MRRSGKSVCTHGGTRTPNLRFRRPTPYPLGHAGTCVLEQPETPFPPSPLPLLTTDLSKLRPIFSFIQKLCFCSGASLSAVQGGASLNFKVAAVWCTWVATPAEAAAAFAAIPNDDLSGLRSTLFLSCKFLTSYMYNFTFELLNNP